MSVAKTIMNNPAFACLLILKFAITYLIVGEPFAIAHDTLDSEITYNVAIGNFIRSGFDTSHFQIFAAGNLDWFYFARILQPISLTYAILPPADAYFLQEIFVLLVAYTSMMALLKAAECSRQLAVPASILFAFGISYAVTGWGIAAAPFYFAMLIKARPPSRWEYLWLFFLAWNSAFAMHVIFWPAVGLLVWVFWRQTNLLRVVSATTAAYSGGIIGATGLIYTTLFAPVSHRTAWPPVTLHPGDAVIGGLTKAVTLTIDRIDLHFTLHHDSWYLTAYLGLLALGFLLNRGSRSARSLLFIATYFLVSGIVITAGPAIASLLPGPFGSLQYSRLSLYLAAAIIFVTTASVAWSGHRRLQQGFLLVSWVGVLSVNMLFFVDIRESLKTTMSPAIKDQLKAMIKSADISAIAGFDWVNDLQTEQFTLALKGVRFKDYYLPDQYSCMKSTIGNGLTLSEGPDPAIALYNGIAAADGYFNLYPLSYKHAFREIIAPRLEASPATKDYYDDWGSRVYSFHKNAPDISLDFQAATKLGIEYVIADHKVNHESLTDHSPACLTDHNLRLYKVATKVH